jgi:hypothetical protein
VDCGSVRAGGWKENGESYAVPEMGDVVMSVSKRGGCGAARSRPLA